MSSKFESRMKKADELWDTHKQLKAYVQRLRDRADEWDRVANSMKQQSKSLRCKNDDDE